MILAGEPREWEAVPYTLDTWSSERGKGLIAIGRMVSEGPGMHGVCRVDPIARARGPGRIDPRRRSVLERQRMTAQDVVSRIQKKLQELGIAWRASDRGHVQGGRARNRRSGPSRRPAWRPSTSFAAPSRPAGTSSSRTSRRSTTTRIRLPTWRMTRPIRQSSASSRTTTWSSSAFTITRMRCSPIRSSSDRHACSDGPQYASPTEPAHLRAATRRRLRELAVDVAREDSRAERSASPAIRT